MPSRTTPKKPPAPAPGEDPILQLTVDGTTWTFNPAEFTAEDATAFRRELGMSFRKAIELLVDDGDIDIVAGLVWMARRKVDPDLTFRDVASNLSYDTPIGITDGVQPAEGDDPET